MCFETVSGLKINYFKSALIEIQVHNSIFPHLFRLLMLSLNVVEIAEMSENKLCLWKTAYLSLVVESL